MTMPSPVPTLCSKKSPKGWNVFSASAAGTVNAPPLTLVPAGAVVNARTWQVSQPTLSKSLDPLFAFGVSESFESRAGASEARMNRAKWSTSSSPSEPATLLGSETVLQSLVTSSGNSRLVIPISFR